MWKTAHRASLLAPVLGLGLWGLLQAESFRPLRTQGTQTLKPREIELDFAVEYRSGTVFPFTRESDQPEREELEIPRIGLNVGVAERVELQFDYTYLDIHEEVPGVGSESGSGDAHFFTKFRFLDQEGWRPDLALLLGAKIPNGDTREKLGTDEADLFFSLLIGRHYEQFETAINLGLGILGTPQLVPSASSQDDVFTYGVAVIYKVTDRFHLAGEVNGIGGSRDENDRSAFLGALRYELGHVRLYLGGSAGLDDRSEEFGLVGGLTWHVEF